MPRVEDLRLAIRSLVRAPGFALAAIATLALGIGATTTLFTVVYGVLLRPLPYPDAGRLVVVQAEKDFTSGTRFMNFGAPELEDFVAASRVYESIAMSGGGGGMLRTPVGLEPASSFNVSGTFFQVLGAPLVLGRAIGDEADPVVVISHRLWQRAFGGDPAVIGRTLQLNDRPHTIVGVLSPDFQYPSPRTDIWRSLAYVRTVSDRQSATNRNGGGHSFIGRLKPGVTIAQARADAAQAMQVLSPHFDDGRRGSRPVVRFLVDHISGAVEPVLLVMMAAVGLVLLIACVNVANLILARQLSRTRETAVRVALGAPRRRLVAQLIAESCVVAMAGGTLGVALAAAAVRVLRDAPPPQLPRLADIRVDLPVLLFVLAVVVLATLAASLIPALVSTTADVSAALKARTTGGGGGARRVRAALVVSEIAIAIVLLVGASLLARSLVRLLQTDLGVTTEQVIAAHLDISQGNNTPSPRQIEIAEALAARLKAMPAVRDVGFGTGLPPQGEYMRFSFDLVTAANPQGAQHMMTVVPASPGYFSTLQVRLLQGRLFSESDGAQSPPVAILNREAARRIFGAENPIGRTLPIGPTPEARKAGLPIVGVVENVKFTGIAAPPEGVIFLPFAQNPFRILILVARTAGNPEDIAADLRRVIREVDADIQIFALRPLSGFVSEAVAQPRFRAALLTSLATIALILAAIGLYGVVAYSVSQRTTEIGVRMALGARAADVARLVLTESARLTAAGAILGLAGAFALRQTLAGLLYGIEPADPASFGLAAAGLLVVALAASYFPARRATRVDPVVALRAE